MNNIQNNINLAQDIFSNIITTDNKIIEKYSDKTLKFIDKLSNSTTEIIKVFLNNNAIEIPLSDRQSKLYHYDNLLLVLTDGKNAYNLEKNLRNVEKENFAPKFVKYYELGDDEFLTVLEGDNETLLPYSKMINKIPNKNKLEFKISLKHFVDTTEQINKEIFTNKKLLFFAKNSKNIIYADWESLSIISTDMKPYYLNQIEKYSI